MKKNLLSFVLAFAASAGSIFASDIYVDGFWFDLNDEDMTASVTYSGNSHNENKDRYSGDIVIPDHIKYDGKTYSVTAIGENAFMYCQNVTSVSIPQSVTKIESYAFGNNHKLTSLTIPSGVKEMENWAIYACSGLKSIYIAEGVRGISKEAINTCGYIETVVVDSKNTAYDSRDKSNAIIETETGMLLFGCVNTIIPTTVTKIASKAFNLCYNLEKISIPGSVKTIEGNAFQGCQDLDSVFISNGVEEIELHAFQNCKSLKYISIPESVNRITGCICNGNCPNFNKIDLAPNNPTYDCRDNCLAIIETATNTLVSGCSNSTIPNTVTKIGRSAFHFCIGLASITIPNSVQSIDTWGFYSCENLKSVELGNSLTHIGPMAFIRCSSLESIIIPKSVTEIEYDVFAGCEKLTAISVEKENLNYCDIEGILFTKNAKRLMAYPIGSERTYYNIPNSVNNIASSAFEGCTHLDSIIIPSSVSQISFTSLAISSLKAIRCEAVTPPKCEYSTFNRVDRSIPLYVPEGSEENYRNADNWKEFKNIKPIPQAEEAAVDNVQATPGGNSVVIAWPAVEDAVEYIIEVKKGDEVICTLHFNKEGVLLSLTNAMPARDGHKNMAREAMQTANGWQYTITGLEANTAYSYSVLTKKSDSTEDKKSGSFVTTGSTALDHITNDQITNKVIRNGQILILRGEKEYTITGQEVK